MSTESPARDDHGDRKRKRNGGYGKINNRLSPDDEGVLVMSTESPARDGHGDHKRKRTGDYVKFHNRLSPGMHTPPPKETCVYDSPSSALTTTPTGDSTGTPFPNRSSANNHSSYSWKECEVQYETDLDLIGGRLMFEHKTTKEVFNRFQSEVQPKLVKRLKKLAEVEAKYENDLEMADSAYLLKLLSFPNPQLQSVAKKAGEGSMLLLKGVKLMTAGRELLRAAISDMPPSAE